jgi:hypothetical protein
MPSVNARDAEWTKSIDQLRGAVIRLDARCDALSLFVETLAARLGDDPLNAHELIEKTTAERHQEMLTSLEQSDPALAARLDIRPPKLPPGLFD